MKPLDIKFKTFESFSHEKESQAFRDQVYTMQPQQIMKKLHPYRYDDLGDELQLIISKFQGDSDYLTPDDWFVGAPYKSFMDYFKRKISSKKMQEIRSHHYEMAFPCECNVESLGNFHDTSSILRLKKSTDDVVKDLKTCGVENVEELSFVDMKLKKCFYHRIHSPVKGIVEAIDPVGPSEDVFGDNTLWIFTVQTEKGKVYLLLVGELSIQDFHFSVKKGDHLDLYQEIGNFEWGSQVVLIYDPREFGEAPHVKVNSRYFVGERIF